MTDAKPSNPKDSIGSTKLQLELVPDTIEAEVALAYLEGALKYGRYNWRVAGVRSSVYYAAMKRHQKKWWNGEDADKKTRVKHLASVMACCGILLDAELCGMLEDDRAPYAPIGELMDSPEMLARIAHLKALFEDYEPKPKQYVLADKPAPVEAATSPHITAAPDFPVTPGRYRTRNGREFDVMLVPENRLYPVQCSPYGPTRLYIWTLDGHFYDDCRPDARDLVERLADEAAPDPHTTAVPDFPITPGLYLGRNGREYHVTLDPTEEVYPVQGTHDQSWTLSGFYYVGSTDPRDLVKRV